jgi:hypothetical protein
MRIAFFSIEAAPGRIRAISSEVDTTPRREIATGQ